MIDKFMYGFLNRVYGYDDYTQLEINSKLIQKIDEVIDECNNAFEFVDWLKEEGVPDEVQSIIDTMLEDGTLEKLINLEKLKQLTNNIETIKTELTSNIDTINSQLTNDIEIINSQLDTITHLTDRKNVIQEDINKAYEKNKIFSLNKGQYNINTLTLKSNVYEL